MGGRHLERQQLLGLLQGHHNQLGEAEAALNGSDPSRSKAVALIRWQLMRHLRSYQLFKHIEIFDPMCRCDDVARARQASAMKTRRVVTAKAYEEYGRKWSVRGIDSSWLLYDEEARSMMALISASLETFIMMVAAQYDAKLGRERGATL